VEKKRRGRPRKVKTEENTTTVTLMPLARVIAPAGACPALLAGASDSEIREWVAVVQAKGREKGYLFGLEALHYWLKTDRRIPADIAATTSACLEQLLRDSPELIF